MGGTGVVQVGYLCWSALHVRGVGGLGWGWGYYCMLVVECSYIYACCFGQVGLDPNASNLTLRLA